MKFETWFKAQFGKRPSARRLEDLRSKMLSELYMYNKTRILFEQCEEWDWRYQAALKAWNCDDEYKKQAKPLMSYRKED